MPAPVMPVQPEPTPVNVNVQSIGEFVVVQLSSVTGMFVAFLPNADASELSRVLAAAAVGLHLPGKGNGDA